MTMMTAPISEIGIAGTSQIASVHSAMQRIITFMLISCVVRSLDVFPAPFIPLSASLKVRVISGSDLIKLIIPPPARAPAPMYLMYLPQIALAPPAANIAPIGSVPGYITSWSPKRTIMGIITTQLSKLPAKM